MKADIRALVLVRTAVESLEDPAPIFPLATALLEVAGKSPLQRTLSHLHRFGLQQVTVVSDSMLPAEPDAGHYDKNCLGANREMFWQTAETAFNNMAQDGAELVLLISLGGYAEIECEKFARFHLNHQARVSQACWGSRPLEVFCISASRRNDAASLFRSRLAKCQIECPLFEHRGYFNPLHHVRDLRQFAIDILSLRTEAQPSGTQVRPGVWMERGSKLEKGARVLAPAFVGASATIRAQAVITRCSSVEHHAQVDLGTIIENSTVLPYCCVGACLDVAHSVVGRGVVANLRRDATVEIADPKLIGYSVASAGERFLKAAVNFAIDLPKQFWRRALPKTRPQERGLEDTWLDTSSALGSAAVHQSAACLKPTNEKQR
jgi:hypothetical protein